MTNDEDDWTDSLIHVVCTVIALAVLLKFIQWVTQ